MKKHFLLLMLVLLVLSSGAAAQDKAYVVATHYPSFGDTQPAPRDAVKAAYTVYNNRENDYEAVDESKAQKVIDKIKTESKTDVVMLNDWKQAQEGLNALQIVNNVPVEGALYTVFLPPGWKRDARLPVVLSGNGAGTSNNKRLYTDAETILPTVIATSTTAGGRGLIGAVSNCGGTESQGIDEKTYRSVGAFLNWIDQNGGDKHNVVTAGGSRGGGSALMWAINPLNLDYTVHTVLAEVPPTHYGSLSQVSPLTYPSMASIGTLVSGDLNAWRYDNNGLHPGMNPSPFMETLIGEGDPAKADAISPIGLAERLKGKQVLISAGAHDAFFQLALFLKFDRRLTELGIPHGTYVTLATGHQLHQAWMQTVFVYLQGLSRGLRLPLPTGRSYFIDANPVKKDEMPLGDFFKQQDIQADPAQMPVMAELPYKAGQGDPVNVAVCGKPGDQIDLTAAGEDRKPVYTLKTTLGADECAVEYKPFDAPVGTYHWTLLVNSVVVNSRNTPTRDANGCGLPATTTVLAKQPEPKQTYAFNKDMSFGLDEYSGQTCS
jgi:hypothetical protein